jgi:hypothetical protein
MQRKRNRRRRSMQRKRNRRRRSMQRKRNAATRGPLVIALIGTNWSQRPIPNDTEDNFPPKPATDNWGKNSIC